MVTERAYATRRPIVLSLIGFDDGDDHFNIVSVIIAEIDRTFAFNAVYSFIAVSIQFNVQTN